MKLTPYQHSLIEELGTCIYKVQEEKKKMIKLVKELDENELTFKEGSNYGKAKKIITNI